MTHDGPPTIDVDRLDFSQFHATGDHWPFSRYCRTQYGGGRVHLAYAWEFRHRDQLLSPWHKVLCSLGSHEGRDGWERETLDDPTTAWVAVHRCRWCWRYRIPDSEGLTT